MIALPLVICILAVPALSLPSPAGGVGGVVGGHGDKYYTDFSEVRTGDEAGNIKGEYIVHPPDGRVQHVTYIADGNYGGTIMDVKYDGEAHHPDVIGHGHGGHV